jgi:CRP-like cAMP-binding protein
MTALPNHSADSSSILEDKSSVTEQVVEKLLAKSRATVELFDRHDLDTKQGHYNDSEEDKMTRQSRRSRAERLFKTEEDKALIRLALHRSSFFTCLDEEQIERFIQVAELRDFKEGDVIIREGDHYDEDSYYRQSPSHKSNSTSNALVSSSLPPTSYVYSIKAGTVEVVQQGHSLCNFGPGMVFGEGAILFDRAHSASVVAKSGDADHIIQCWVVPAPLFRDYVITSENMIRMFSKYASQSALGSIEDGKEPYLTMV